MTDLQKDQAIYNEMLKIANEVFDNATANVEGLRKYMNDNGGVVSINEILSPKSSSTIYGMIADANPYNSKTGEGMRTIEVDTFKCTFPPMEVFFLLKYWKSLAKVKEEIIFTYEEKIDRAFVGTVEISLDNASSAKTLANYVSDDVLRPMMNYVLIEINATKGDINFVATDGRELSVISNNPSGMKIDYKSTDIVFQALFSKADWKRICDHARKQKSSVCLEIYKRGGDEEQDTMVAILGDTKIKSAQSGRYPKWKSVLPDFSKMKHFAIADEDVKDAQKWLSKVKVSSEYDSMTISAYEGSDIIYFDTESGTTTFKLSKPSDVTIGSRLSIKRMQSKKFYGFWFSKENGHTVVDDANCDLMLVMPIEGSVTPCRKEREVVHELQAA